MRPPCFPLAFVAARRKRFAFAAEFQHAVDDPGEEGGAPIRSHRARPRLEWDKDRIRATLIRWPRQESPSSVHHRNLDAALLVAEFQRRRPGPSAASA